MARSVYIAGLGPGGGKSTIALGLAELLSRQVARLGVFRPLVPSGGAGLDPRPCSPTATRSWRRTPTPYGVTLAEAAALVADGPA